MVRAEERQADYRSVAGAAVASLWNPSTDIVDRRRAGERISAGGFSGNFQPIHRKERSESVCQGIERGDGKCDPNASGNDAAGRTLNELNDFIGTRRTGVT